MRILLINNDGGGFADYVEVAAAIPGESLPQDDASSFGTRTYGIRYRKNVAKR